MIGHNNGPSNCGNEIEESLDEFYSKESKWANLYSSPFQIILSGFMNTEEENLRNLC